MYRIHVVFVPVIEYASLCLLLYYTLPFLNGPFFNVATIYTVLIGGYTLALDVKSGALRCFLLAVMSYFAYQNVLAAEPSAVWTWLSWKAIGTSFSDIC